MHTARVETSPWRVLPRLVGATLLLPAALAAQEPLGEPLGEPVPEGRDVAQRCTCTGFPGGFDGFAAGFDAHELFSDRPRIGIVIGDAEEDDGRTGARIMEVVEGGPADRAGLRAGDIIVSMNGRDLEDEPAAGVVEHMDDVEPNDTVTVVAYRDGDRRTFRVIPEAGPRTFSFGDGEVRIRVPDAEEAREIERRVRERIARIRVPDQEEIREIERRARRLRPMLERAAARVDEGLFRFGGGELELTDMNEGLGRYFGTSDGVLVVEVDEDSDLGLRAGDVLLSIDGREVRDARHVRSIIQSYRPDEEISMQVMRDNRRITVRGERED